jgi:hypothetical protein
VIGLGEDRVQRGDDRHPQLAQQRKTWTPALPPKMPYSCCTHSTSTPLTFREVRRAPVRCEVAFGDLEANARRIRVLLPASFIASTKQSSAGSSAIASLEIGREGRDPAARGRWLPSMATLQMLASSGWVSGRARVSRCYARARVATPERPRTTRGPELTAIR